MFVTQAKSGKGPAGVHTLPESLGGHADRFHCPGSFGVLIQALAEVLSVSGLPSLP